MGDRTTTKSQDLWVGRVNGGEYSKKIGKVGKILKAKQDFLFDPGGSREPLEERGGEGSDLSFRKIILSAGCMDWSGKRIESRVQPARCGSSSDGRWWSAYVPAWWYLSGMKGVNTR